MNTLYAANVIMKKSSHHLAQLNIAKMKSPLDDPIMSGFVAQLDAINALAEQSPGFIWRLQTEEGDATSLRVFDDPDILINMSVWESVEALHRYVYQSGHLQLLRDKKSWFDTLKDAHMVLWWVPAGHIPTIEEARRRLDMINELGPSPDAFSFRKRFSPPGEEPGQMESLDECPWTS